MNNQEIKKMLTKPQIARLKQLTNGLRVGSVLGSRVLVKVVEPYTEMDRLEKESVLVIPETVRESYQPLPTTGIVIALGVDTEVLQEGDMVMFSKYGGTECYFNEEGFRILDEKEILCTLESTEELSPVAPIAEG